MINLKLAAIRLADISGKSLAIFGLLSLIYAGITIPDKMLSNIPAPQIWVTPFCAPLLDGDYKYEDGTKAPMELRGIKIETDIDISDLIFRIDNQSYVASWLASSNGTLPEDIIHLVGTQLPRGKLNNKSVFGKIPRLMAGTDVIIEFKAVTSKNFNCASDWFQVSSPNHKIFHRMWPDAYFLRERSFVSPHLDIYKYAFFGLAAFIIIFIAAKWRPLTPTKARGKVNNEIWALKPLRMRLNKLSHSSRSKK